MTEEEWLACEDPTPMLELLKGISEHTGPVGRWTRRKLRLFAVACCRKLWERVEWPEKWEAIELFEQHADGRLNRKELMEAYHARNAAPFFQDQDVLHSFRAAFHTGMPWFDAAEIASYMRGYLPRDVPGNIAFMLRCIFGPMPFRAIVLDSGRQSTSVSRLVQAIHDDRAFDRLPILADALEDAGCHNADILEHCRQPGEHCRGCWVVDLLLDK